MKKLRLWAARIILLLAIGAIGFGLVSKFLPPASIPTEVIEVPDETPPSGGGLVSQEELKAASDKLVAGARDFGSDCVAAEAHNRTTRGDARCRETGGMELIYSDTGLPEDPASKDAERPIPVAP